MEKWIILNGKQFYNECTLIYFDAPLLFVARPEGTDAYYLALCIGESPVKYVLAGMSSSRLLDMLTNKITMEEAFRAASPGDTCYLTYDEAGRCFALEPVLPDKIKEEELPDKGEYLGLRSRTINACFETLTSMLRSA